MNGDDAYVLLLKKIKGILSGVSSVTVNGTTLNFVFTDGTSQSMTFPTPKDGLSITDVDVNADNTLTCTLSDGSTVTTTNKISVPAGKDGVSPTIVEDSGKHGMATYFFFILFKKFNLIFKIISPIQFFFYCTAL